MSISKVHELLQNKGCVWTVSILMVLGVVFTSFAQCSRAERFRDVTGLETETPVAKIGEFTVTDRLIRSEVESAAKMYGTMDNLPPQFQLQIEGSAVSSSIGYAYMLQLAKKYGVEPSDDQILKMIDGGLTDEFNNVKQQLITQKKLAATATEADFAKAFKKATGKEMSDARAEALETYKQKLAMPDLRMPFAAMAVNQPLMDAIKKTITLSDEDLKKAYDNFEFKKITLSKGDTAAVAKKAQEELKAGTPFETAIQRYSNDEPVKGKKLQDMTSKIARTTIDGFAPYRPLADLKPGQVSDLVKTGPTITIYKLLSVKSELPKDFDKKKATYRDSMATTKAAAKLQGELAEMQKTGNIEWKEGVYKLLYDFGRTMSDPLTPAEKSQKLKEILKSAQEASLSNNPIGARLANLVAYVVFGQVYDDASPTEKSKLNAEKAEVIRNFLEDHEDVSLRLELAEIFLKEKKKDDFFSELESAANANVSVIDVQGQSLYSRINKLLKEGKDANLLTEAQAKTIQDLQSEWVNTKKGQDKIDAETKAADEQARKEAEAADKAARAESAKEVKTKAELEKEKAGKKK
ncbi:MAG: SurA N-terminal domain-containing protein [Fimbriimonadaceae bacterium]|nr:SurA N-terminal domain-containing protein [Fimbriimonadaceae bacterium]